MAPHQLPKLLGEDWTPSHQIHTSAPILLPKVIPLAMTETPYPFATGPVLFDHSASNNSTIPPANYNTGAKVGQFLLGSFIGSLVFLVTWFIARSMITKCHTRYQLARLERQARARATTPWPDTVNRVALRRERQEIQAQGNPVQRRRDEMTRTLRRWEEHVARGQAMREQYMRGNLTQQEDRSINCLASRLPSQEPQNQHDTSSSGDLSFTNLSEHTPPIEPQAVARPDLASRERLEAARKRAIALDREQALMRLEGNPLGGRHVTVATEECVQEFLMEARAKKLALDREIQAEDNALRAMGAGIECDVSPLTLRGGSGGETESVGAKARNVFGKVKGLFRGEVEGDAEKNVVVDQDRGLADRGLTNRGLTYRGWADRGLAERGLADRGREWGFDMLNKLLLTKEEWEKYKERKAILSDRAATLAILEGRD